MKKAFFSMVLIICIIGCIFVNPMFAIESPSTAYSAAHENIEAAAISWVKDNYGSHYYLRNIEVALERTFNSEKNILKEKLIVTFEKMLIADSVEKLPYVIGLRQGAATKNNDDIRFLNSYIASLSEYIGTYTNTCIDIVGECSTNNLYNGVTLYYQDVYTTTLYPINVLQINVEKMRSDGMRDVDLIVDYEKKAVATRGYDSYDRIAARDYAQTYTSNDISVCSCTAGANCTSRAKYNTSYWNTNYSIYPHTDCANYSSQAMAAGGIPTDTTWYKDSLAWVNSNSLKTYMTTNNYWDSSTFAAANAGNILRWKNDSTSPRHTVIITLNDTVTHQYSGHTADRLDCVFSESSSHEYFTIKTTS